MAYEPKNYEHLKGGAMKGFSDSQLDLHFTLYKGYLVKLNEIEEKLTWWTTASSVPSTSTPSWTTSSGAKCPGASTRWAPAAGGRSHEQRIH